MELKDFLAKYPETTRNDLATICNCSLPTVTHWFVEGNSRRQLKEEHKLCLAIADYVWSRDLAEPEHFHVLRQIRRKQVARLHR
ncbi:hypothetical protein Cri9333_0658 [Crinalium epipsammum PCC 9333]|uniref:Uncharacterized protein n=1 Tax=Crinalium epipsammum PCC 9333 TaxID=1173022 RepID=K9VVL9_9CYAN|nr:hypothetical protein [Crinalium epipsammum]AFZ11255.1 hypothetical protein Cri9333_0265 [Crinalium epipsammum PCC 9333]AFZ11599.1 hypothetical protein Cri9333_0658 [Crinalium epipsammum PCC 9333]